MDSKTFEARMRGGEAFSGMTVLDGMFVVIRVDGKGFSKYTERMGFEKPFDAGFSARMVQTLRRLMVELGAVYGHTHSDEISVLLKPGMDLFNRRAEKLISVSAGLASAEFGECFDARLWLGVDAARVVDYFSWRQADAVSNGLSSWAYWTLRQDGISKAGATRALMGADDAAKNELLFSRGINFNDVPAWTKRGVGAHWVRVEKPGFNPVTEENVTATRTLLQVDSELPVRQEYRDWLALYLDEELNA